ncbi:NADP-dependent oxidoreductase [Microbacterium sp. 2FI]|uniref:NADP-dependent oxidoreductase n=1 Tax=Microbacterium sp. 2FI TaxID=2502193 RepID=UPI0010F5C4B4|nr:NADP-dependent oxidoreductase [Microbacterium sp. 2FI]
MTLTDPTTTQTTTRAYLLTHYGPDGLTPGSAPAHAPGPGEVSVRLEAIAINPLDAKIRSGLLAQMLPLPLPVVIGSDAAGTVLAVGAGVTGFSAGDRVAGFFDSGAFAETAVSRATRLTRIPGGLSTAQAAALPTAAETATRILGMLEPAPASTVVVNGAAGSVGSLLTQLLVRDGHTVIGTARPENHDYLRSLGATPIAYGPDMVDDLRRLAPEGIDAAFDTAGNGFIARVVGIVDAPRIVTIIDFAAGAAGAIVAAGDPTALTITDAVRDVFDRAASGDLRVEIGAAYRFDDLPDAVALSEGGHARGKIIVVGAGVDPAQIGIDATA